ncbi:SGNH/GDSL hydrolase family protein [Microbacterium sp. LWH3-1.2]|uniref:SGNH/GDSL hydrolase family protein n=1 Tax=Microbacterium sp. LWH3-1.2 TaxID=3135256 RepID=UPI003421C465
MTLSREVFRRSAAVATAGIAVGAGIVLVGGRAVLERQAAVARRRIGKPLGEEALDADRVWGRRFDGPPLEFVVLGDSIAAGLGAQRRKDTLGARLAKGLARAERRPVRLRTAAIVGSESSLLAAQVDALPADYRPDAAVIVVGGNDITHRVPVSTSVGHLEQAIVRLRARGAVVVVGTCPDLGALRPVPQPLRALGSRLSRQLADAQAIAAARTGARAVSLGRAVGPFFVSQPDEMFSLDRFHPSSLGYRRTAEALLPPLLAEFEAAREDPVSPC